MLNDIDPYIIRKHWAGDDDILVVVQNILKVAKDMVGEGVWEKIKSMFT